MPLSLYAVTVECDVVVLAESASDAEDAAVNYAQSAGRLEFGPGFAHEVKEAKDLPSPEWLDSLPAGAETERTVRQILAGGAEEESEEPPAARDTWTLSLFPEPEEKPRG